MSSDIALMENPTYKEMSEYFHDNFGLYHLAVNPEKKFMLFCLIGYLVRKAKEKQPDITYYRVVKSLTNTMGLDEHEIYGLAILSEEMTSHVAVAEEIPTFGLQGNDIIKTAKDILMQWMPF